MKENLSHLTDDELAATAIRNYYVRNKQPHKLKINFVYQFPMGNTPTYSLECPKCGHTNCEEMGDHIWPRKVIKSNSRKLEDALYSSQDSISIGFSCESCLTDYDLIFSKGVGLEITLEEKGYWVRGDNK